MDDLNTLIPYFIGALAFGAVSCLLMGVFQLTWGGKRGTRARLDRYAVDGAGAGGDEADGGVLRDRRFSKYDLLNAFLADSAMAQSMALELAQARLPLRVGEYLMLRLICALGLAYLLMNIGGNILAVVPGTVLGYYLPKFYVSHRKNSRIKALETQLVDALTLSANSLRAGWGFTQAMSQIANELPPPISVEFSQALQEVSIGASPEDAISNMVKRIGSYDVELVMTGVLIQREIGGNLAEMMDKAATTIRERMRLLGDIQSIVAESRLSMYLLSALPVFLLVFTAIAMPDYTMPFLEDPRGRVMLLVGGVLEVFGVLIMKQISRIEV